MIMPQKNPATRSCPLFSIFSATKNSSTTTLQLPTPSLTPYSWSTCLSRTTSFSFTISPRTKPDEKIFFLVGTGSFTYLTQITKVEIFKANNEKSVSSWASIQVLTNTTSVANLSNHTNTVKKIHRNFTLSLFLLKYPSWYSTYY